MTQNSGDAQQESKVYIVTRKDVIGIGSVAGEFTGKPSDGALLSFQFFSDKYAYWFHGYVQA
ncbi:MAG: hypothetical protein J6C92_07870 [Bacteroidaceae bacterium]|nr:hypothetical protein [Bacteroidaceae bacterium]